MFISDSVDGFRLAYARQGKGAPVVALHGWPGDHGDWRKVATLLVTDETELVTVDLRGFGESDKHLSGQDVARVYSAAGQAAAVLGLIDQLELKRPVIAGYNVGSRVAQRIAREAPDRVAGLVLAPPLPGVGDRVLSADAQREYWYQTFHQLDVCEQLIDGDAAAIRAYISHFWSHWSGPSFVMDEGELGRLTALYGAPGAFMASIAWYRARAGTMAASLAEEAPAAEERIGVPTKVLWPSEDPLFPFSWSDRLDEFFSSVTLERLDGIGHFSPLEAPERWAEAIRAAV